jgi:hypothetical protein
MLYPSRYTYRHYQSKRPRKNPTDAIYALVNYEIELYDKINQTVWRYAPYWENGPLGAMMAARELHVALIRIQPRKENNVDKNKMKEFWAAYWPYILLVALAVVMAPFSIGLSIFSLMVAGVLFWASQ